jgi:hypothetical protein
MPKASRAGRLVVLRAQVRAAMLAKFKKIGASGYDFHLGAWKIGMSFSDCIFKGQKLVQMDEHACQSALKDMQAS